MPALGRLSRWKCGSIGLGRPDESGRAYPWFADNYWGRIFTHWGIIVDIASLSRPHNDLSTEVL